MLKIVPKDGNGIPITDLEATILDTDIGKPGIQELKEWVALTEYLTTFPDSDKDGVPDVPERYEQPEGQILVDTSWNPIDLLKGGKSITFIFVTVAVLMLVLIGLSVWGIVRLFQRAMKPKRR
jgi:5'-nucleotidase/UDP-sugar diphosphatase